jgi:hypothetical protein
MAASDRSRRTSRPRKSLQDSDSDVDEKDPALMEQAAGEGAGPSEGGGRESDRLAKIQEKNRKAQQKYDPPLGYAALTCCVAHIGQAQTRGLHAFSLPCACVLTCTLQRAARAWRVYDGGVVADVVPACRFRERRKEKMASMEKTARPCRFCSTCVMI